MSIHDLIEKVCAYRMVSLKEIKGLKRDQSIVNARHGAMYLALKMFPNLTQSEIAIHFCRDRTTTLHARDAVVDSLAIKDGRYEWVNRIDLGASLKDDKINELHALKELVEFGHNKRAIALIKQMILKRTEVLYSLSVMKADQMLHEQTNQL